MIHFGNLDHNVLVMRSTTAEGFRRETRFWPERGLIHCEDNIDGYSSFTVRAFLHRINALSEMLGRRSSNQDTGADNDMRIKIQRDVDRAVDLARIAQEQGMPFDPSAARDLALRRPKTLCMADSANAIM